MISEQLLKDFILSSMWGVPAAVLEGNVLGDLSEISGFKNLHWMRVKEDERRESEARIRMMLDFIKAMENDAERAKLKEDNPQPPLADITINHEGDQVSFDFS